jgi:hypothetical protein
LATVYLLFRRTIRNALRHRLRTVLAAVGIVAFGLLRTTVDAGSERSRLSEL